MRLLIGHCFKSLSMIYFLFWCLDLDVFLPNDDLVFLGICDYFLLCFLIQYNIIYLSCISYLVNFLG